MNQYAKVRIICYPGYARNYLSNPEERYDLALIELDRPIRHATEIYLNDKPDESGDTATGVGFGASAPADSKTFAQYYGIKLAGQNIIDSVGSGQLNHLALNCTQTLTRHWKMLTAINWVVESLFPWSIPHREATAAVLYSAGRIIA